MPLCRAPCAERRQRQRQHPRLLRVCDPWRSGDNSTRGQIGVSFALAFIGIALALVPYLSYPIDLAPGLAVLGLSGLIYARHAQRGDRLTRRAGFIVLVIGVFPLLAGAAFDILGGALPLRLLDRM